MEKIKAIIIDDEVDARDVLSSLLGSFCKEVDIIAEAANLEEGVKKIKALQPDIVFLDIQMPQYAGYEIVNFFDTINFSIIFITAFDKYAMKAFEISALDYILKPIEVNRLKQAVEKATEKNRIKIVQAQYSLFNEAITKRKSSKITITDKGESIFIEIEDIIAIEGQSAYSKMHLISGKQYVLSRNLKQTAALLEDWDCFFRSHKSWLINTNYIHSFAKTNAEIKLKNNIVAKLSRYKKADFDKIVT